MSVTAIRALAGRLRGAALQDAHEHREVFESIRQLRSNFEAPLEPECLRCLEAASMLVAYLARMGDLGGEDVRAIALRLLESAARAEEEATSAPPRLPVSGNAPARLSRPSPAVPIPDSPAGSSVTELMGDMMLGQILLQRGHVLEEHLHQAIKVQRATSIRIGDILVKIGACSREQLDDALSHQAALRRVRGNLEQSGPPRVTETDKLGLGLKLVGEALLGEILVERKLITRRHLDRALEAQKRTGMRIGEALVQMGATTIEQIEQALLMQRRERRFGARAG